MSKHLCDFVGLNEVSQERMHCPFDACDKNHDGVLSQQEFSSMFRDFLRSSLPQLVRQVLEEQEEMEWRHREADVAHRAEIRRFIEDSIATHSGTYYVVEITGTAVGPGMRAMLGVTPFSEVSVFTSEWKAQEKTKPRPDYRVTIQHIGRSVVRVTQGTFTGDEAAVAAVRWRLQQEKFWR